MMSETTIDTKVVDTYKSHAEHERYQKDCSSCFARKLKFRDNVLLLAKQQKPNGKI